MHKLMLRVAQAMAIAGGLVLSALIVLTCISITGRVLNTVFHGDFMQTYLTGFANWALEAGLGPLLGDFELVEAGMAFAIFAFIPLCQITSGHATVDVFTSRLPQRVLQMLRAVIEVVFAAVLVLLAMRLYEGMSAKMRYGETTYLIQFPIWWAYAAAFAGSFVSAVIGVYMAALRVGEALTGRIIVPEGGEIGH